jgi:hypothetical protein
MWLFEEIIKLIVGKCLCTVRTRFRLIAEDGRMKGFFVHLYQREKFGATIPTSKHQLRHSFAITRISYFNIKLSTPIEQSNEKNKSKHTINFHRFLMLDVLYSSFLYPGNRVIANHTTTHKSSSNPTSPVYPVTIAISVEDHVIPVLFCLLEVFQSLRTAFGVNRNRFIFFQDSKIP